MKNKKYGIFTKRALANLAVLCGGVLLFMALFNISAVAAAVGTLVSIFSPFIYGVAIAYLLNMPMRFFERKVFWRFKRKRGFSILATYLLALVLVVWLIGMVVPQLVDSILNLVNSLPSYLNNLNELLAWLEDWLPVDLEGLSNLQLSYAKILTELGNWVQSVLPEILAAGMRIGSGIVSIFTALIASIYMLASKEKLMTQCKRVIYAVLPKRHSDSIMRVGRLSNGVFSGFIGGKILDSVIIGIICFVGMSIMALVGSIFDIEALRMQYTLLISVLVGVTNIIPFFGPFIGAIPSALILLMVNPWSAVWFVVFILVLQQFDGNILGPKILGNSTGLPAMWVLVAIIVGGGLFGFAGMLLGVPATAVLYTLGSDFVHNRLRKKGLQDEPGLTAAQAPGSAAQTEAAAPMTEGEIQDIATAPYVRPGDLLPDEHEQNAEKNAAEDAAAPKADGDMGAHDDETDAGKQG